MKDQKNSFVLKNQLQRPLRRNMTDAEQMLWKQLRGSQLNGHKFRRQHPFGDFILDFVCLEIKLVIEIDGSQHMKSTKDKDRDQSLANAGFTVVRFWNNQVLTELDSVVEAIWNALEPHPHPNLPLEPHPLPNPPLEREGAIVPSPSGGRIGWGWGEGEGAIGGKIIC